MSERTNIPTEQVKHPMQPVYEDASGVLRFKGNAYVMLLVELASAVGVDLNALHRAAIGRGLAKDDEDQFNQLIGYSVYGAPITPELISAAAAAYEAGESPEAARARLAEDRVDRLRKAFSQGVADLYNIHPDDLL